MALLVTTQVAGCGAAQDPATGRIGALRSSQARDAAREAGLDVAVQDFMARAARGATATFTARYAAGTDRFVVHQRPPDRRVDVQAGGRVVEAVVVAGDEVVVCERPAARWTCEAAAGDDGRAGPAGVGAFSPEVMARTIEALRDSAGAYTLSVDRRTVAGVAASCLVTETTAAEEDAGGTFCVAPDGAPLLLATAGSPVLRAITYRRGAAAADVARPDASPG